MNIAEPVAKNLKVGDRIRVTCDDPRAQEPNFGTRVGKGLYPKKGWTGKIQGEYGNKWVILWDKKTTNDPDYTSGDLVYEWQIGTVEWDSDENV